MRRLHISLLIVVMISAASVVSVRHKNRLAFVALQQQERRHDALQVEWGRLMLEQATWTRQHNVADAAQKSLAMTAPSPDKIIMLDLNNGDTAAAGSGDAGNNQ